MKQATVRRAPRPLRTAVFLPVLALLAAAAGGGNGQSSGGTQTPATQASTTTQAAMAMPPGHQRLHRHLRPGRQTDRQRHHRPLPRPAGQVADQHVLHPAVTVSMQNVKPGRHTLTVVPALNDHAEVEENATSVTIDYQPANPLPTLTDKPAAGTPSIKILEPQPGATVSGRFDVTVQISNFNDNCDLFGKPGLVGYGHWHLNLDSTSGAMGAWAAWPP